MNIINDALIFFENFTQSECKGSYRMAATRLGIPYQTFYSWMVKKDRLPTLKALEPCLARLNVKLTFPNTRLLDYEFVPCCTASLNSEGNFLLKEAPHTPFAMERNWLIQLGASPASTILLQVADDSMAPTLALNDYVLLDRASLDIKSNKIYLVSLQGELMMRRLVRTARGLTLHADNPLWLDVDVDLADYAKLTIHGLACWHCRTF